MNLELFNKIKSYLERGKSVEVSFYPHHKGCDTFLDKNSYKSNYIFFYDHFSHWWCEDLSDMLISKELYGDGIDVQFELKDTSLFANVVLDCSIIYVDFQHNKREIVTPFLVSILINKLKLSEANFDEELIEFNINYNGSFSIFEIFYDNQKIKLIKSEIEILKTEISIIIDVWTGLSFGENKIDHDLKISICPYDEFTITDTVTHFFKVEPKE